MKTALLLILSLVFGSALRAEAQTTSHFPHATIPSIFPNEESEKEWYALNFWSKYDFSNPYKYEVDDIRKGFIDFVDALYQTPPEASFEAVDILMNSATVSEDGYWCILEAAELVLYDPSSPMRNDLLWEPIVRHAVGPQSPLDEVSKMRYQSLLKLVSRNQQGDIAADFTYTLPNGQSGRLHTLTAPYTLVYFYNPGCSECLHTKNDMLASGALEFLHANGIVKVLALYCDNDINEWRRLLPENPSWWISAYDKGGQILSKELYDLKAIPTIYLLDKNKMVLMKDPIVEDLNDAINQIANDYQATLAAQQTR